MGSYQYQKLLTKYGLTDSELSTPLKKRIVDIRKLQDAIAIEEKRVAEGNMTLKKKENLEEKIKQSKEALPVMDDNLINAIEKWYPNRERFAKQGQRLQQSRAKKVDNPVPIPGTATSSHQPAPSPAPAPPIKPPKKEENTPSDKTEVKSLGFWGWAGLFLAAVALGTVGVAVAQQMNKKAA